MINSSHLNISRSNKIVVAVCVHDRIENIQTWISCWKQCDTGDAQLVIVHNYYGKEEQKSLFSDLCKQHSIFYLPVNKYGFDIGRFQDVCLNRLPGFPQWDKLLWCADDTFPMSIDFIKQFEDSFTSDTGVSCMCISPYVRTHIRTTGFMIDRDTATRLKWNVNPVMTKKDCYQFEHRDPKNSFYNQVVAMGRNVVQVAPDATSPLWDSGYHRRIDRSAEHRRLFNDIINAEIAKNNDDVTFVCPIYKSFPAIISCLIMQTNPNWRLLLIHNGPDDGSAESYVNLINDDRIEYYKTETHTGNWGHVIRRDYLNKVTTKYVVITNPDNYYCPTFIAECLKQFSLKPKTIAAYSAKMIHSYIAWGIIECRVKRGYLDCGGVMMKTKEVQAVGWKNITDHSADWFFFNDISIAYGVNLFTPVPGCLFVHN